MQLRVFVDSDQSEGRRRAESFLQEAGAAVTFRVFDVVDDGGVELFLAASSPLLFGGDVWALGVHGESLDPKALAALSPLPGGALALVVTGKLKKAQLVGLDASGFTVVEEDVRSGSALGAAVRAWASERLDDVDVSVVDFLTSRVKDSPGVVRELLTWLRDRSGPVVLEDVLALFHNLSGSVPVWSVSDAVERGDVSEVIKLYETQQPVVVATWMARRYYVLRACLVEGRAGADALGLSGYAKTAAQKTAAALGESGVAALSPLRRGDIVAKAQGSNAYLGMLLRATSDVQSARRGR